MNLKEHQADLMYKLGLLLSPLQEIADHPERHDAHSRARAGAKFFADAPKLEGAVHSFTQSEPAHDYRREWRRLHAAFHTLASGVEAHLDNPVALSALLKETYAAIRNGIPAIPIPADAGILEAHSPFSTYCVVKDLCETVTERLIWVDRYLVSGLFHRYLRDVPINVNVTLLTWPASKRKTKREAKEFSEFLDVSRLYAAERGPDNYRLVVHPDIHDRWLCCDGQIYALGGSVKDASQKSHFTLSKVDPTVENFHKIDQLLNTGTDIYGPTQRTHS